MKTHTLIRIISLFIMMAIYTFIMVKCANPVSPTGGPKDETPPIIVSSKPENYSSNFSDKKMSIQFNEFVQLRSLQNQLLISPPMEFKPEIKIKKRSVVIEIDKEEILSENTTYTIFMGNSVVDLTENNPHLNLEYVFSTGHFVDSLSIRGNIKNTFTGFPSKNVSVLLYADENDTIPLDSMPLRIRPNYVAKTDDNGEFGIYNLRNVPYKIFALNDQNGNYLYDLPYENIAFLDSMINPYYTGIRETAVVDSTLIDSIPKVVYEYTPTELFMFTAIDSTQDIAGEELLADYKIQILLDFPCKNYLLNPLNFDSTLDWKIDEPNISNDSIILWLKPLVPDTIQFEFIADGMILDTLEMPTKKPEKKSGGLAKNIFKKKESEVDSIKVILIKAESNVKGSIAELNQKVKIDFDYPLESFDFSKFIWIEDSISTTPEIQFADQSKRHIIINKELSEENNYQLIIPDSILFNIHGNTNDSLIYNFATKKKDEYGNLILTIEPDQLTGGSWIVQLMSPDDVVLKERIITEREVIRFEFMTPGTYKLRAIHDQNNNGHWDTGNYAYKRQAEKVIYLGAEIELRANWDYEENWNLK